NSIAHYLLRFSAASVSLVVACGSTLGCTAAPVEPPQEDLGRQSQAVWASQSTGGSVVTTHTNDGNDPESNSVFALLKPVGDEPVCTGVLMTAGIGLTSRYCAETLCGGQPRVAIGAARRFAASDIYATSGIIPMPDPSWSMPDKRGTDLALVVLARPVLSKAQASRAARTLASPQTPNLPFNPSDPSSTITDSDVVAFNQDLLPVNILSYSFKTGGTVGWSPLDSNGVVDPINRDNRQQLIRQNWQAFRRFAASSTAGFWHHVARKLVGIASLLNASSIPAVIFDDIQDYCMSQAGRWICDSFIDITQGPQKEFLLSALRRFDANTPAQVSSEWSSHHPRLDGTAYEPWKGEVDYVGEPPDPARDPDLDHVLQTNNDGSSRDNCPDVYNPDQDDTDGDGLGDTCDPHPGTPDGSPVTLMTLTTESFTAGTSRTANVETATDGVANPGTGSPMPLLANNVIRVQGRSNGRGSLTGRTQAMTCPCAYGSVLECARQKICIPPTPADPRPEKWRYLIVVKPDQSQTKQFKGEFIPTGFADTAAGAEDDWAWMYWFDGWARDAAGKPTKHDSAYDVASLLQAAPTEGTKPVYHGVLWTWVKNFGPTDPGELAVTESQNADRRTDTKYIDLQETVPTPIEIPRINLPEAYLRWRFPFCRDCPDPSILKLDRVVNPAPMSITANQAASPEARLASPSFTSSAVAPRMMLRSASATQAAVDSGGNGLTEALSRALLSGSKSLVVATDSASVSRDAPVLAVVDPQTHALIEAYGYLEGTQYRALSARVDAPPTCLGKPLVAALSSGRSELVYFGENLSPTDQIMHVRTVNIGDGTTTDVAVTGLSGSIGVLAAVYSERDNSYYVLDVGLDSTGRVARLVRVDASNQATVLNRWTHNSSYAGYDLTVGDSNILTISASRPEGHAIVVLVPKRSKATVRAVLMGSDQLAMPAMTTANSLSIAYQGAGGAEPLLAPIPRHSQGGRAVARDVVVDASDVALVF
ncbi:MAG: hypothetical protein MUF54_08845, partial [Polyangiaceae bacterium]|nr:hypothetical protein [Polyangiaceae bacterium]